MKRRNALLVFDFLLIVTLFAGFASFVGCFGNSKEMLSESENGPGEKTFVEATIEYLGPHEQWSGPQNFSIQVSTLKPGNAQITINPPIEKGPGRQPSSVNSKSMSNEVVREYLARLNAAFVLDGASTKGCLSPIRVKLVRSDGSVVERHGCRGLTGWPRVASELTHAFIEGAI